VEGFFPLQTTAGNAAPGIPLSYRYNPISFGKPKETGLRLKEKFIYPLQFAPANAVPLAKGTKTPRRKNGGFDSRPPSFRPTAVFILHLPLGCYCEGG